MERVGRHVPGCALNGVRSPNPSCLSESSSTVKRRALRDAALAYGEDTTTLLRDVGSLVGASFAWVDRHIIEAHLDQPLSDQDWDNVRSLLDPLAFDQHVGDAGTLRTDWIDDLLTRAQVGLPAPPVPSPGQADG